MNERLKPDGYTGSVAVLGFRQGKLYALVGDRPKWPFEGMLALPGGFAERKDNGHALLAAARELQEETGLEIAPLRLRHVITQDQLDRDPRGWIVDNVFGLVLTDTPHVEAKDDLKNVRWVQTGTIHEMAFDHLNSLRMAIALLVV